MRTISETSRLAILVLLLPVILIFVGPLLVLAALRGSQGMGPITWDTSRYDTAGRLGILMLGMALWLLVWVGLVWLFLTNPSFQPVLAQILPPTPAPELAAEATSPPAASPTQPPLDTPTPLVINTETSTSTPAQPDAPTASPTSTLTPLPPTPTPPNTLTPVLAGSPTVALIEETEEATLTPSPTATRPSPTATATATPAVTPTPQPTPTFGERQAALETVRNGNALLREAISLANEENIANLETVWEGKALTVIEKFALDLNDRYTRRPLTVAFEYVRPPAIETQPETGQLVVTSQENWSYSGPTTTYREAFEFIYSLERVNGRWMITTYTFRNLPTPRPAPTRTPTSRPLPTTTPTG